MFKNWINQRKINKEYSKKIESLEKQCESLRANIYEIKNPKCELFYQYVWGSRKLIYTYATSGEMKEIPITYINSIIKEYKANHNNNNVYVGIKYELDEKEIEKYFIIDKLKSVVIEYKPEDVFKNSKWVVYDKELVIE